MNLRGNYTLIIRGISREAGFEAMEHFAGGAVALYNDKCYPLDDDKPWELRAALPEQPHESELRELLREAWHQLADARLSANLYGEELERVKDEVHLRVLQNEEEQDRWKETEDRIHKHLGGESDEASKD